METLLEENISNFRVVAWDTETTGVSSYSDYIIEVGAIAFDEDFELRRFETLAKPPVLIPAGATKIHGISDEMVAHAPRIFEGLAQFSEFLSFVGQPRFLVAHNAGFDVGMVHGQVRHFDEKLEWSSGTEIVIDTCMMAKVLLPELPQHRVEDLVTHFKLPRVRFHRAMADVEALKGIFLGLIGVAADRYASFEKGFTLSRLIDLAGGYFLLDPKRSELRKHAFFLPPRIAVLEKLCGQSAKVAIVYDSEEDYRYITPIDVRVKAFRVYVEAFCHRDNIKKTFRADRILRIGKVEDACVLE
ncbi:MAG: exonuclease domain-containing protein [Bdellovibrionota bacterium]